MMTYRTGWSVKRLCYLAVALLISLPVVAQENVAVEQTGLSCDVTRINASFMELKPEERSEDKIKEIQTKLKAAGFHPGRIDGLLGNDTDIALSRFCLSVNADKHLIQQAQEPEKGSLAITISDQLIKIDSGKNSPKPILLSGGGCGCSRDFFPAFVYGFYPYWLADGEHYVADFSLYDRIGYFGLKLNEEGEISNSRHWPVDAASQPNAAGFINQAHKHRVKVDITFSTSSWQDWSYEQINRATDVLLETVTREYESENTPWWRVYMPLVENTSTAQADGINLFFDEYTGAEQGANIVKIVNELSKKLKLAESDVALNIMIGLNLADVDRQYLNPSEEDPVVGNQFKKREAQIEKLEKQFKALEAVLDADEKIVDNVFVFLTQDTSKSKKNLRQIIENAFSGAARKTVLRKIVPIVVAQGLASQKVADQNEAIKNAEAQNDDVEKAKDERSQFEDDLIYLENNFKGVGLWHLPLTKKTDSVENQNAESEAAELSDAVHMALEKIAAAKEAAGRAVEAKGIATEAVKNSEAAKELTKKPSGETKEEQAEAAVAAAQAATQAKTDADAAQTEADAADKAAKEAADIAMAAAAQADVITLRQALKSIYQLDSDFLFMDRICELACPNRWMLLIAFDLLVALQALCLLLAGWNCHIREKFVQYIWVFVPPGLLTVVILLVLFSCDPALQQYFNYLVGALLLAVILRFGVHHIRELMRPPLP